MAGVFSIIYVNFSFEFMAFGDQLHGERKKTCSENLIIFCGLAKKRPKMASQKNYEIMHSSANQRKSLKQH